VAAPVSRDIYFESEAEVAQPGSGQNCIRSAQGEYGWYYYDNIECDVRQHDRSRSCSQSSCGFNIELLSGRKSLVPCHAEVERNVDYCNGNSDIENSLSYHDCNESRKQ